MQAPIAIPDWKHIKTVTLTHYQSPELPDSYTADDDNFQYGGPRLARDVMHSFLPSAVKAIKGSLARA